MGRDGDRPNPDDILARVQADEARDRRAKLKVFFGFAPGVGKTYAMLEAARRARDAGTDVVVGVVETHGRSDTARLLEGLTVVPRVRISHRGTMLEEMDVDAVLARRPRVVLVDELAHTNAPGVRHSKRWQDVLELLDGGVDVWTTVNVQHLASLTDVVAQITHVRVREVVPDHVLDRADEIELVDIPPEELLQRLREGKVYLGEQAERAAQYFFQRGNLLALRELALRRTAEGVDRELLRFKKEHGISGSWPTTERLLVCVGPAPQSDKLVRATRRMAAGLRCPWIAMSVQTGTPLADADRERIEAHLKLAESLGAEIERAVGQDVPSAIIQTSQAKNVTRIIVGKPRTKTLLDRLRGSLVDEVVRHSGDIDVHVISGDDGDEPKREEPPEPEDFTVGRIAWPLAVVAVATGLCFPLYGALDAGDLGMVYLLAIMMIALWFGRVASIIGAVASVAAFDFFFVPPRFTFTVSDGRHVLTFAMMFGVGLLISTLTLRLQRQERSALQREARKSTLFAIAKKLGLALGDRQVAQIAADEAARSLSLPVVVLVPESNGELVRGGGSTNATVGPDDLAVAKWTYEHTAAAGAGTETLPGARVHCVPLSAGVGALGVLVVCANGRPLPPDQRELLDAIASQTALALERWQLAEESNRAAIRARTEELRSSLLSAVSHDLRTPLAAIAGAASTLVSMKPSLTESQTTDMLETIEEEAQRMERLVTNLLDMTRIEAGGLVPKRELVPLEEIVGSVSARLEDRLAGHALKVDVPADLPMLRADPVLLEQALLNLVENAIKYTPRGTTVLVRAAVDGGTLQLEVLDEGPGIGAGEEEIIFDKFYRGQKAGVSGAGLGLPICKGIVEAHGGSVRAMNRPEGGACFRIRLPLEVTA